MNNNNNNIIIKNNLINNVSENKFIKWLNNNKIHYWYIEQSKENFSFRLKELNIKRPDFFILIPNFGFISLDIKDKSTALKHEKFFFSYVEVEKYLRMQRIFNIPCWFVISNKINHYKTWFWIPVSKIIKNGFIFTPKNSTRISYSVPLSEFIQVSDNDSLERVFSKFIRFI